MLPLALGLGERNRLVEALLDSGSDVNVLSWRLGVELGAQWQPQKATLRLWGTLAGITAMPLLVSAQVGALAPVRLAFAWCQTDDVPLVLGQTNFFMEFDICFFRSRAEFSVVTKCQPNP
jgi:hypothetical protein